MTTEDTNANRGNDEAVEAKAERIAARMRTLKSNSRRQERQLFSLLFPVIVERLQNNVLQKDILDMLKAEGLTLHPAKFKKWRDEEADKAGNISGGTQPFKVKLWNHQELGTPSRNGTDTNDGVAS